MTFKMRGLHDLIRSSIGLPVLTAALIASSASASAPNSRERASPAAMRAHTSFLANDLLEGRDAGTRGFDLASAYVAAQFESLGLKPGGDAGNWYQTLKVRRRTLKTVEMTYLGQAGTTSLVNGKDVAVDASPYAASETLNLELVFVGWGIDAPALGFRDYDNLDVRGKAVVLLEGAPSSLPPALRAHYSWIQQKERMAAAHGAAAILTIKSPARERFSPWERARVYRPLPAVNWIGSRSPGEQLPPKATVTLGPEFARTLVARAGRDLDAVFDASERGPVAGFPIPGRFTMSRESSHEDAPSQNVIGLIEGRDPKLRNEYVVIVSHLDHVGVGPAVNGDRIYNGAVDNAGGIAAMIEAARVLAAGKPPLRSILFIATTGEERGLLGSDYYVTNPTVPLDRIVAAISVDGLMAFHDFGGIVALGAEHSTLGEISRDAAARVEAIHVPDPIPDRGNLALSDQYPFLRKGIPVLFPNPARGLPRTGSDGTAEWDAYEKSSYHQPSDDMSLPLRWDVASRWADYISYVIEGAANARQRPTWYAGDVLADGVAPNGSRVPRPKQ